MSLIRYNLEADFGVPYMDEDTTGDWVRLDDVVKLLEEHKICVISNSDVRCEAGCEGNEYWSMSYNLRSEDFDKHLIALIRGENR